MKMDINRELEKLIFQYDIDKPFPRYRKIIEERGYVIYPSDDVINDGRFLLKSKKGKSFDLFHVICEERSKLKASKSRADITTSMQKLVFMFVYIKDFVNAYRMLDLYKENRYIDFERYQSFSEALKDLFSRIVGELENRKKSVGGDIINYWLDSLDYGWERRLPYLNEIAPECVCFENAYTFTPWTHDTMKNILTGEKTIDDNLYQMDKVSKNCRLIQMLQDDDMEFCYCGCMTYSMEEGCYSEAEFSGYSPSALILWEMLKDMLASFRKKTMYLAHILAETHAPWLFPTLEGEYYTDKMFSDMGEIKRKDPCAKERCIQARLYADEQLRFYDSLLGDAVSRIYMSDHGEGVAHTHEFFHDLHHIILMVRDSKQNPQTVSSCFSYVDYDKLIKMIIEGCQITNQIGQDYVLIQSINYCAKTGILNMLSKETFFLDRHIAYRGVITAEDNYLLRSDGYERYHRNRDRINYIGFSKYRSRIDKLRRLAGREFPDIYKDERFQYSRAVQQVIDRYKKRVGKEEIGISMIKEYVDAIPEGKCIAVRGGGEHTMQLLSVLADRCRRISYIVDRNTQMAPPLGIPVISPEELKEKKPDIVLISSLKYHKEFSEEMASLGISCAVYDIYEELGKKGIHLELGFYENCYLDEDFEGITV